MTVAAPEPAGAPRAKLLVAWAGVVVSTAGLFACLTAATMAMHDMMVSTAAQGRAGFCASGGPFEVASECDGAQFALIFGGIIGALVFAGIQAGFLAWVDGPQPGVFALVGAMLAAFGWNFLALGLHTPGVDGIVVGWLICGIVFWLMAIGCWIPLALRIIAWIRRGGAPEGPLFAGPTVRAAVTARGPGAEQTPGSPVAEGQGSAAPPPGAGRVPTRLVPPPGTGPGSGAGYGSGSAPSTPPSPPSPPEGGS